MSEDATAALHLGMPLIDDEEPVAGLTLPAHLLTGREGHWLEAAGDLLHHRQRQRPKHRHASQQPHLPFRHDRRQVRPSHRRGGNDRQHWEDEPGHHQPAAQAGELHDERRGQ